MLLGFSLLLLLIVFVCLLHLVHWLLCNWSNFSSGPIYLEFYWLFVHGLLFLFAFYLFFVCFGFFLLLFYRLWKFYLIIVLKKFTRPLTWESSLLSIPLTLKIGLLIMFWPSWMLGVRSFGVLHFLWLLYHCFLWYLLHYRKLFLPLYSVVDACIYDL